jgi:hypothetical protein
MIARIEAGGHAVASSQGVGCTFREFLPVYWQMMGVKNRLDLPRPKHIIDTHLLPRFGDRPLDSLSAEDGLGYITDRLKAKAAA